MITDNVQWDFDSVTAYATYSNLYVAGSGTYKSCSGSSTNCASTNMPSTPSAPAPDVSQFNRQFEDSIVCATFYGATAMPSKTYYQTVTVNGNNGRGNFTFEYKYLISSSNTAAVAAHTYWTGTTVTNGITFNVNGVVAAASYMSKTTTTKYSFTLVDSSTLTRVQAVYVYLQKLGSDGVTWSDVSGRVNFLGDLPIEPAQSTISCALLPIFDCMTGDFIYVANGGTFGSYPTSGGSGLLVSTMLLNDTFLNNNNDLASGNVHFARFNTKFGDITEVGTYRVRVAGTLKGNSSSGTSDQTINATSTTKSFGDPNCP